MLDIEIVDRYGPGGPPPWIMGCHGDCEATGFYPENNQAKWPSDVRPFGTPEEDGTPDDGWRFIKCDECSGTGRVDTWTSIKRIPRWLFRSISQIPQLARPEIHHPASSIMDRWKLSFYACLGKDMIQIWYLMKHYLTKKAMR